MLVVGRSQLDALDAALTAPFLDKARRFIEARLCRSVSADELETLSARGRAYGFRSEQELVRYCFIAAACEAAAGDEDPPWIVAALRRPAPSNRIRLERLYAEATSRISLEGLRASPE